MILSFLLPSLSQNFFFVIIFPGQHTILLFIRFKLYKVCWYNSCVVTVILITTNVPLLSFAQNHNTLSFFHTHLSISQSSKLSHHSSNSNPTVLLPRIMRRSFIILKESKKQNEYNFTSSPPTIAQCCL